MKSVIFKFWVTREFSQRHCNLKPKRFDFCIEYKPVDRTCPFHYQWLELFGLLEEIGIKSSVAFIKCFSIYEWVLVDNLTQVNYVGFQTQTESLNKRSWWDWQKTQRQDPIKQ